MFRLFIFFIVVTISINAFTAPISTENNKLQITETVSKANSEFWLNVDYWDEIMFCKNAGYNTYEEKEISRFFRAM